MYVSIATDTRLKPFLCVVLLGLLLCAACPAAQAETVVRIEQDWELVVGTPDPDTDSPQVVCVISPVGNVQSLYAAFELNQQSLPEFNAGGMQLQVWSGETTLVEKHAADGVLLEQEGETIDWTQSMELCDGVLAFEITNGASDTWGAFGGLRATVNTTLADLNGYDPAVSVRNSGAGFASNRVGSLVIKRTRFITAGGQIIEDDTQRTVYPHE
jgi:hypothetical protein